MCERGTIHLVLEEKNLVQNSGSCSRSEDVAKRRVSPWSRMACIGGFGSISLGWCPYIQEFTKFDHVGEHGLFFQNDPIKLIVSCDDP